MPTPSCGHAAAQHFRRHPRPICAFISAARVHDIDREPVALQPTGRLQTEQAAADHDGPR